MNAKEFERQFWRENDPMTTPIYKCLEAYAKHLSTLPEQDYHKQDISEQIIQAIERNAVDNNATITNVKLWAESWRREREEQEQPEAMNYDTHDTAEKRLFKADVEVKMLQSVPDTPPEAMSAEDVISQSDISTIISKVINRTYTLLKESYVVEWEDSSYDRMKRDLKELKKGLVKSTYKRIQKLTSHRLAAMEKEVNLKGFVERFYEWHERMGFATVQKSDWYEYIDSLNS